MSATVDWAQILPPRVQHLQAEVAACCRAAGRDPAAVRILAVTKTVDATVLPVLAQLGLMELGENRIEHLESLRAQAAPQQHFHFIGRLQGRQIPAVVAACTALHSLHDPGHVERLVRACRSAGRVLEVFVQVNLAGEAQKAGLEPAQLPPVLEALRQHSEACRVVGLMTMAPDLALPGVSRQQVADCFAACRTLAATHGLKRLSMGMSGDWDLAIAAGATEIRVGSRLFATTESHG